MLIYNGFIIVFEYKDVLSKLMMWRNYSYIRAVFPLQTFIFLMLSFRREITWLYCPWCHYLGLKKIVQISKVPWPS